MNPVSRPGHEQRAASNETSVDCGEPDDGVGAPYLRRKAGGKLLASKWRGSRFCFKMENYGKFPYRIGAQDRMICRLPFDGRICATALVFAPTRW
ncbi:MULTISPECIES: hypothetical protein [Sphingopyxis]|uniref:hypothetical protein n=1 Tax=Sphingopyxis TaxID=165697 RepID=UPI00131A128C|nr:MULTISPECIES: hypothetical protein [Sphingopyxis]